VVTAGLAGKSGYKLDFLTFTKYGAVVTVINLVIVTAYILIRFGF
jgi:Na+/H+ antiporter NhaD/arsenite permease-like protein